MVYTLGFFSSKCSLFHNSNVFGSCIIHILYTGCAKIKNKNYFLLQKVNICGFSATTVVTETCHNIILCCITGLVSDTQSLIDIGEQRENICRDFALICPVLVMQMLS